jgi:hypothetical protein
VVPRPLRPTAPPAREVKPGEKPAEPAKTPEVLAAEKKAADDKLAADATAALEKSWGEYKPTLPEGYKLNPESFKEFSAVAKELGLAPEKAQKLVEFQAKQDIAAAKASAAASDKYFADQRAEFLKQTAADKDFTANGATTDAALVAANKAFNKFIGPEALKALRERHPNIEADPVLFKAFFRIGQALKDDSIAGAAPAAGAGQKTQEQMLREMYPNSPTLFSQS